MSISFKRNNAQEEYERFIGVTPEILKDNKEDFKNHCLSHPEVNILKNALKIDAVNFFYSGIFSFSEAIDSIYNKRFSWATVELYYSIYYFIRASMASNGIALLRCNSMYRLVTRYNEKPYATNNRKYNTTHEGTINHYKDLFDSSDKLLTNNIDGMDVYQWMMNAREIVNYRSESFLEPNYLDIWDYYSQSIDNDEFCEFLDELKDDDYIKCFQEEYAIVAIPIKRLQQSIFDLSNNGITEILSIERKDEIKKVIDYDNRKLNIFSELF